MDTPTLIDKQKKKTIKDDTNKKTNKEQTYESQIATIHRKQNLPKSKIYVYMVMKSLKCKLLKLNLH